MDPTSLAMVKGLDGNLRIVVAHSADTSFIPKTFAITALTLPTSFHVRKFKYDSSDRHMPSGIKGVLFASLKFASIRV